MCTKWTPYTVDDLNVHAIGKLNGCQVNQYSTIKKIRLKSFQKLFYNSLDKLRRNNANPLPKIQDKNKINSQKLVENGSITDKYTTIGYSERQCFDKSVPLGQNEKKKCQQL